MEVGGGWGEGELEDNRAWSAAEGEEEGPGDWSGGTRKQKVAQ